MSEVNPPVPLAATTAKVGAATKKKLSRLRFYGDEFVFDTVSGMFYRLSPTTSFILHSLESGAEADQLPALLGSRYGIELSTATRDVELFFNDLAALELIGQFHP